MKTRIILFLLCLITINVMGQGTVSRKKCNTCGKVIAQCQYKGKHPKPKQEAKPTQKPKQSPKQTQATTQQRTVTTSKPITPAVKTCEICAKPISQCDYGGKHPFCQTCGKLKERCEYKGEHPVCQTCGQLKEKCEYKGEHPVCQTCGQLKEKCEYKGEHPVCKTCGKLKDQCEYKGEHPSFSTVSLSEKTFTVGGVAFTMMPVQGGTFTMEATSEQQSPDDYEKPTHRVSLSSYYIGKYEVTQALWKAVMGSNPSKWKGDNRPVEYVSWNDCQTFLRKLNVMTGKNFRLPTDAEWEYAARGGNHSRGYQYSGSNNLGDVAWYDDNSRSKTHPVGTKAPNELGIYDMSGNVLEWCQDLYGSYSSSAQTNPTGPSSGSYRVFRGGGWSINARFCRVAFRACSAPGIRSNDLGLRLALSE